MYEYIQRTEFNYIIFTERQLIVTQDVAPAAMLLVGYKQFALRYYEYVM